MNTSLDQFENLFEMRNHFQSLRAFNAKAYLNKKIYALDAFFRQNKIDSVILGISGGIDSALVLFLLNRVIAVGSRTGGLKKVVPLSMPIRNVIGVTGQDRAAQAAKLVMVKAGYQDAATIDPNGNYLHEPRPYYEIDLGPAYKAIVAANPAAANNKAWVEGQMASILRTPILYYHAAKLQDEGYRSLVAGTTNRDEGSYIGFFGKASDAMVDLQPIADLHKSEVYELAEYLGVPHEIIEAKPRGDVWDEKVDEEMIGAPYWFLELYLQMKELNVKREDFTIPEPDERRFDIFAQAIEEIHAKNAHKYKVGNPAHFVDVQARKIPGGWE